MARLVEDVRLLGTPNYVKSVGWSRMELGIDSIASKGASSFPKWLIYPQLNGDCPSASTIILTKTKMLNTFSGTSEVAQEARVVEEEEVKATEAQEARVVEEEEVKATEAQKARVVEGLKATGAHLHPME